MKIYVICDMEGTAGVINHVQQCCWDLSRQWFGSYYEQARRMATLELNALVEGALEGGAAEIVAWDGHGSFPGGIDIELLHPQCRLVMGAGDGGPMGLDNSFGAMFQVGLHAMAGTKNGVLAHSFHGGIEKLTVNGMEVGEIWMNCYTAGLHDVPCVFLSGDEAAAREIQEIVSPVETAVVKWGISNRHTGLSVGPAISLSPKKAASLIAEKAKAAMSLVGKAEPLKLSPPFTLQKTMRTAKEAEAAASQAGVERVDEKTLIMRNAEFAWELI